MVIELHNSCGLLERFEGSEVECIKQIASWSEFLEEGDHIIVVNKD